MSSTSKNPGVARRARIVAAGAFAIAVLTAVVVGIVTQSAIWGSVVLLVYAILCMLLTPVAYVVLRRRS